MFPMVLLSLAGHCVGAAVSLAPNATTDPVVRNVTFKSCHVSQAISRSRPHPHPHLHLLSAQIHKAVADLSLTIGVYVLCEYNDTCKDLSCDYLHDSQWNARESPGWLIQGINTFSAEPEREASRSPNGIGHFCLPEDGKCGCEDDTKSVSG